VQGAEQCLTALMLLPIDDCSRPRAIDELQREVLEAVALGRPLHAVLDLLWPPRRGARAQRGLLRAADREDGTVTPIAGPSLPVAYAEALRGAPIGPRAGSCGTAAWRREAVEVTDILDDPLWADYRALQP